MTEKKKWKDHFLSSGVPLEYSVVEILKKLNYIAPREYIYERFNEDGQLTQFSIDISSVHISTDTNMWLEIFVECKYRHESTRWIFSPMEPETWAPRHEDTFLVLDQYDLKRKLDKGKIKSFAESIPFCRKGIELLTNDHNHKSIEQAVHQLRYALISKAADAIIHQVDEMLGTPTPLFMLAPIIITTAELWRLKPYTTIEDIRKSDKLEDVAQPHDILLLHKDPDNFLISHTKNYFNKRFNEEQKIKFDTVYRAKTKNSYEYFTNIFSKRNPSVFIVLNYSYCEKFFATLIKFAEDDLITNVSV